MSDYVNSKLNVEVSVPKEYEFKQQSKMLYQIPVGEEESRFVKYPAPTLSDTNFSYEWNVPDTNGVMSIPTFVMENLTLRFSNAAGNLTAANLHNAIGLAMFDINAAMTQLDFTQGGTSLSNFPDKERFIWAGFQDLEQNYAISQTPAPDVHNQYSPEYNDDPLKCGADTNDQKNCRGLGCKYRSVTVVNDDDTIDVTLPYLESRVASDAFDFTSPDAVNLVNMKQWRLKVTLQNLTLNLTRSGVVGLTASIQNIQNAKLYLKVKTSTPNPLIPIPDREMYAFPWTRYEWHDQTSGLYSPEIPANGTRLVQLPEISESRGIPDTVVVFSQKVRTAGDFGPDVTHPIVKALLNVNNKPNLLQDYDIEDLYRIAVKNGYTGRPSQFSGELVAPTDNNELRGNMSFLVFRSADLALNNRSMGGVNEPYKLSMNLTLGNQTTVAVPAGSYVWRICFIYSGTINMAKGQLSKQEAIVPYNSLLQATDNIQYNADDEMNAIQGGKRGRKLWNAIKKGFKYVKPLGKRLVQAARNSGSLKEIVGDDTILGQVAQAMGAGVHVKATGSGVLHTAGKVMKRKHATRIRKNY